MACDRCGRRGIRAQHGTQPGAPVPEAGGRRLRRVTIRCTSFAAVAGMGTVDTDLLKTFLEVNRTRHFGKAADNLFVSQSAVSARIRQLEELVGVALFTRDRNNIQTTVAGQKLVSHAERILNHWNRALQEIVQTDDQRTPLAVAGETSLWDIVLQDWLNWVDAEQPDVGLNAEALSHDSQLRRLLEGSLDLSFVFEAPQMPQFLAIEVMRVPLVMVAAKPGLDPHQALRDQYLMVDWGTSFAISHARYFPEMPAPRLRVGLGRLARSLLLECGGAAYLARPMVAEALKRKQLHLVKDAPVIDRSIYAVYANGHEKQAVIDRLLDFFATAAGQRQRSSS